MKIALLTTDTLHHAYFLRALKSYCEITHVFLETKGLIAPFETAHSFEREREIYEQNLWFNGKHTSIKDLHNQVIEVESMNHEGSIHTIKNLDVDLIVVFGTGKLSKALIDSSQNLLLNLHGGDPRQYRGLDTHLWAIYHNEYDELKTSLHAVEPRLDTGDLVEVLPLQLTKNMKLHQLRAENTRVCVQLVFNAIDQYKKNNKISFQKQETQGRYYSFMPDVLKNICLKKFEKHTSKCP